jgi:hypothetical protein
MKFTFISSAICLLLGSTLASAQSTFRVRNSTWQDFTLEVQQAGTSLVPESEWQLLTDTVLGWWDQQPVEVFSCNRTNTAVAEGDTAVIQILLRGAQDTLRLRMQLIGFEDSTAMQFAIDGPDFSQPWTDSPDFQELETTLMGKTVVIKYRADNSDADQQRNVFFTIHDLPIYEISAEDFSNPNVMNAMFYNIQMLPFGVSGLPQAVNRASLFPAQISPYQDVVMYCEVFDDGPRQNALVPAMQAAGFPYKTEVLNPNNSFLPIPWNGGVMFFSRWPIEFEDDYDFTLCGQAAQDCLASKGIKYARVNKLGKRYHLFGTHMEAGGQEDDILAKRTQMGEIRDFIDAQNIPDGEPVIFGGDFNISPIHPENLYPAMLDSIGPYIPYHIGFYNSTFDGEFGKIIDNAWGDRSHLVALEATNDIITMRSLEPVLWELGEFSDHRCALGRFVYPDIEMIGAGDTVICPGESIVLSMQSDTEVAYQWEKDGEELPGETTSQLTIASATEANSGQYRCVVRYEVIYGDTDDPVTQVFFPNGADTVRSAFNFEFGQITVSQPQCALSSVLESSSGMFSVFPNPSEGMVTVRFAEDVVNGTLLLTDLTGRQLYSRPVTGPVMELDLSGNAAGMYLLLVETGGMLSSTRICIH